MRSIRLAIASRFAIAAFLTAGLYAQEYRGKGARSSIR